MSQRTEDRVVPDAVSIRVFAPAKINLALHVTGQRDDGYHLLDSLVAFADVGDVLSVAAGGSGKLTASGPFAGEVPLGSENLVLQVAALFRNAPFCDFHLEKHLPIASGIGGGSADAAACFRAMQFLAARIPSPENEDAEPNLEADLSVLAEMGADIPMCVKSQPARVLGIGDRIEVISGFPELNAVLVNPSVPVATPDIFRKLDQKNNSGLTPLPHRISALSLLKWLATQRNDLEVPAVALVPPIGDVLECLRAVSSCRLARMSGSGATCFGLFDNAGDANAAAERMRSNKPHWWVRTAQLGGGVDPQPQLMRSTT